MKTGSIDLSESVYFPKEGSFNPNGNVVSIELFSADLSESSIEVEIQGSLSKSRWDTLQEAGVDISETLTSGVALCRSFEVDPLINIRFKCGTATGNLEYIIFE